MAMAATQRMLGPRAPTISRTTIASCGHGGPPAHTKRINYISTRDAHAQRGGQAQLD